MRSGDDSLRRLPSDLSAEKAVLGAVLISNELLATVMVRLSPAAFFRDAHTRIYKAMLVLNGTGDPIDILTIGSVLTKSGEIDEVGGYPYLSQLTDGVPKASNIEAYANRVTQLASMRQLIKISNEMMSDAYEDSEHPDAVLDRAANKVLALAQGRAAGALVPMSEIEPLLLPIIERHANKDASVVGVSTGFSQLDRLLWGMKPGQLIIVAGRPSMGKTSFVMNVAEHVGMDQNKTVAVFSLEMSKDELGIRLLASRAQVSGARLLRGTAMDSEYERIAQVLTPIGQSPIYVDDTAEATPFEIRAKARALKASPAGLSLIVVDYLQLMHVTEGRVENRTQEISQMTRGLRAMAKELQVPVIVLSQLSRESEKRQNKRPMLSDLRESGSIEQDADVVMFIHREEVYKASDSNRGKAEIIIAKHRGGQQGVVELNWTGEQTRFHDLASQEMFD